MCIACVVPQEGLLPPASGRPWSMHDAEKWALVWRQAFGATRAILSTLAASSEEYVDRSRLETVVGKALDAALGQIDALTRAADRAPAILVDASYPATVRYRITPGVAELIAPLAPRLARSSDARS